MLGAMKRKWKLIAAILVMTFFSVGGGAFASFYGKSVKGEALLNALNFIESGGIPDSTPEFKNRVKLLMDAPPANLKPGAYKNVTVYDGVIYDSAMVLAGDGTYNYAMTVGNGNVHKTYQHAGRWWVEGGILNTVLMTGDSFLASPEARDKITPMQEIIVAAGVNRLVLKAHYSNEPVEFLLEK